MSNGLLLRLVIEAGIELKCYEKLKIRKMKTPFKTDLNTCFRLFNFKKRQSVEIFMFGSRGL